MGGAADLDTVGLEAVIRGIGTYAANAGKIVTSNQAINKSLAAVGKAAALFQKAIVAATKIGAVAIGIGIAASINVFKNFDQAMTESIAIMGDVSDAMRQDMEKAARDVAKTTTFSMTQAAESFFFLASAGLSATQSIAALPQVAAFAQAGAFDMATATDLLTDAQSALGLVVDDTAENIENMARVSDVLVKANTLANATVEQFSTALTREAGAALKSFKIDVEEGVAVLAAFADQGVKGEIAGTGLSRILRIMTSAAVNNSEAYDQLGISVFDANGKINNLGEIIADLENALGGMSDETRVAALEQLGFTARIQGVILPLLGTSEAIAEYEAGLRSAGGITEEVADKQLTSLSAQFSLLRSAIEDVLFTIGKELEPGLRALVRILRDDVIPVIEEKLPQAIDQTKKLFAEWRVVVEDTTKAIRTFFEFILTNQAAIVAALAAIGIAMIAAFPQLTIAAAVVGIIASVKLLTAEVDELGISALKTRGFILKLALAAVRGTNAFFDHVPIVGELRNAYELVRGDGDKLRQTEDNLAAAVAINTAEIVAQTVAISEASLEYNDAQRAILRAAEAEAELTGWTKTLITETQRAIDAAATQTSGLQVLAEAAAQAGESTEFFAAKLQLAAQVSIISAAAIKLAQSSILDLGQSMVEFIRSVSTLPSLIQSVTSAFADMSTIPPPILPPPTVTPPDIGGAIEDVEEEIEEAAVTVGRIAGISFRDAFADAISDLPGVVDRVLGDIGRIAVRPTIESAQKDIDLATLRLEEAEIQERAAEEQAVRLSNITDLEEKLAIIRENSARKVADLEGTLAKIRADSVRQISELEDQLVAVARQRRRILGEPEPPPDPVDVSDLVGTLEDAETKLEALRALQKHARSSEQAEIFLQTGLQIRAQEEVVNGVKAAIEERLAAEEARIQAEIALKEVEFAKEEARIQAEIALQQTLVMAAETRIAAEIAALERLRGPNEQRLEDIQDEIDALGDLAKQRGLERDLLLARIAASNNLLKSDADIIAILEDEIQRVDDLTAALGSLDPATVDAIDALILLQLGLDDFAQELLEVLAIIRNPALQAGTAATMFSAPRFHQGGIVPGSRGQEVPAILQAGEVVLPAIGTASVAAASLAMLQAPQRAIAQGDHNSFHTEVNTTDSRPSTIANAMRMVDLEMASRLKGISSRGI